METEKSFSGEEAEKDFCGRLFFLAAIFPFSNEKACLGVTAKTDFFYRLNSILLLIQYHMANISARYFYIFKKVYDHAMHNLLEKTASPKNR